MKLVTEEQPNNSIIEVEQNNIDINTTNNNNLESNDEAGYSKRSRL
jgi:hypothetical protein